MSGFDFVWGGVPVEYSPKKKENTRTQVTTHNRPQGRKKEFLFYFINVDVRDGCTNPASKAFFFSLIWRSDILAGEMGMGVGCIFWKICK